MIGLMPVMIGMRIAHETVDLLKKKHGKGFEVGGEEISGAIALASFTIAQDLERTQKADEAKDKKPEDLINEGLDKLNETE